MLRFKSLLLVVVSSITLNGCNAIKDEGEIDYRKTIPGKSNNNFAVLEKKYEDSKNTIKKNENISLHLAGGFSLTVRETKEPSEYFQSIGSSAEYVIIAKVCELGKTGCGDIFSKTSDSNGRVVYFTDSLKAKQFFNFSYLPIYGPIKYEGGPLLIQIYGVELDINSPSQKQLFNTLASLGKSSFAPASPVLSALEALGSTLTSSSDGNDSMFRYTLTLMPENSSTTSPKYPTLSAGNYVFLKKETVQGKQEKFIWDSVQLDQNTGKLVKDCKNKKVEFRENSYITLQIQSGFEEAPLNDQQTLSKLTQELIDLKTNEVNEYITIAQKYAKDKKQDRQFSSLMNDLQKINKLIDKIESIQTDIARLDGTQEADQIAKLTTNLNNNKDKQKLKTISFATEYEHQLKDHINCLKSPPISPKTCDDETIIPHTLLTNIIIELRKTLRKIDSSISDGNLNAIAPIGLTGSFNLDAQNLINKLTLAK